MTRNQYNHPPRAGRPICGPNLLPGCAIFESFLLAVIWNSEPKGTQMKRMNQMNTDRNAADLCSSCLHPFHLCSLDAATAGDPELGHLIISIHLYMFMCR